MNIIFILYYSAAKILTVSSPSNISKYLWLKFLTDHYSTWKPVECFITFRKPPFIWNQINIPMSLGFQMMPFKKCPKTFLNYPALPFLYHDAILSFLSYFILLCHMLYRCYVISAENAKMGVKMDILWNAKIFIRILCHLLKI